MVADPSTSSRLPGRPVSTHTLRRNPDLLREVRHLRENSHQRSPINHADPTAAASCNALEARLLASQGEVADLRRDLAQLRRDAHQVMGTTPPQLARASQRTCTASSLSFGSS